MESFVGIKYKRKCCNLHPLLFYCELDISKLYPFFVVPIKMFKLHYTRKIAGYFVPSHEQGENILPT